MSAIREGGGEQAATPGLHGTGLGTVTAQPSGRVLAEGGAVELPASEDLAFAVEVQNQGQSTEQDVTVEVAITGAGRPMRVQEQIDTIDAGQTQTVTIPIADPPPTGRPVTIEVEVARCEASAWSITTPRPTGPSSRGSPRPLAAVGAVPASRSGRSSAAVAASPACRSASSWPLGDSRDSSGRCAR